MRLLNFGALRLAPNTPYVNSASQLGLLYVIDRPQIGGFFKWYLTLLVIPNLKLSRCGNKAIEKLWWIDKMVIS
jgi:hypothetical protein